LVRAEHNERWEERWWRADTAVISELPSGTCAFLSCSLCAGQPSELVACLAPSHPRTRDGIMRLCAISTAAARRPRLARRRERAHSFYCRLMVHTGVVPVYCCFLNFGRLEQEQDWARTWSDWCTSFFCRAHRPTRLFLPLLFSFASAKFQQTAISWTVILWTGSTVRASSGAG